VVENRDHTGSNDCAESAANPVSVRSYTPAVSVGHIIGLLSH